MQNYKNNQLEIIVTENDNLVNIKWLGHSRTLDPAVELDPYLNGLLTELQGKTIFVDFSELISMNSSTIMPIIFFIRKLEEQTITAEIHYNGKLSWQNASFVVIAEIIKSYKNVKIMANQD